MADRQSVPDEPAGITRDHLANERTLLAWTRTALAAAALGFVIAKLRLDSATIVAVTASDHAVSPWAGAAFVLAALAMQIIGIWRYIDLRVRLRGHPFRPLGWAMIALSIGIAAAILLLFVYLVITWPRA
ncbi:MAG: DUF202 domain-containing protein [Armatimonadota bacterium]|nr:MAG: DUF202 domain-containing protein [Armatimonadota bacterium]